MSITLDHSPEDLRTRFYALTGAHDVGDLLEITHERLIYNSYVIAPSRKYRPFEIPKASGQNRRILSPNSELKIIQQKLNQVLQAVYEPPKTTHGFVIGRSVRSNAELHIGQRYVFNIDLADFFPSINFGRVRGLLMSPPYSLPASAATVIAQICCFKNELPQGAPTSPIISNMICAKLDHQLLKLAWDENCIYTRYADDITFSSSQLFFPNKIARWVKNRQTWETGRSLGQTIANNGFIIHPGKVRMQTEGQRQMVTGIVVNERANLPRQYIRQIRAMLHAWKTYEEEKAEEEYFRNYSYVHRNRKYRGPFKKRPRFRDIVKGKIEYLGMVRGKDDPIYLRYQREFYDLCGLSQKSLTEEENAELDEFFTRNIRSSFRPVSEDSLPPDNSISEDKTEGPHPEHYSQLEQVESSNTNRKISFDDRKWRDLAPFPLASILYEYTTSTEDEVEKKYKKLLEFFEALAEFIGIIQLSGFINDEQLLFKVRELLHQQKYFFANPAFGEWVWLIKELSREITKLRSDGERLPQMFKVNNDEFYEVLGNDNLSRILYAASKIRNDDSHHRLGDKSEANLRLLALLDEVESIFKDFWENYVLIRATSSLRKSGNELTQRCAFFEGSQKSPPHQFVPVEGHALLDEDDLYLHEKGTKHMLLILPFVKVRKYQGSEKINVCYFYNARDKNTYRFVSFESEVEKNLEEKSDALKEVLKRLGPIKG